MKRFLAGVICVTALGAPVFAQAQKDSLASLIQTGQRKAALERIRAGADVNAAQPDGTRPIHWAVFRVDHELLEALLAKKAKADVTNEFGSAPIAEAAKLGDAAMVKMLLDAGSGAEGANPDGQTALMAAIKTGEVQVVDLLIQAGANVNAVEKSHNQTPLMWAAAATQNAGEMVNLLLAKGANVKPRSVFNDWPSQITSEPRAQYRPTGGLTALLYAARNGCLACVDALLDAGAGVNLPTPEGVTPLIIALDNGHNAVAKLLLDRGANPNLWDWWGRTALYVAVDRKAAMRGAVGRGAQTPLARPAGSSVSHMEVINALLGADVDPNPQMNMHRPSRGGNSGRFSDPLLDTGCTPLLRAAMAGDLEVVQALLAKGASPNVNDMGQTAFHVAAGVGSRGGAANIELMDLLLSHGAEINAQISGTKTYSMRIARAPSANEGMTALHAAAQLGRTELVRYLLAKGANTEILDANGRKPIDLVGVAQTGAAAGNANPRGGAGTAASAAEIRTLLNAASKK